MLLYATCHVTSASQTIAVCHEETAQRPTLNPAPEHALPTCPLHVPSGSHAGLSTSLWASRTCHLQYQSHPARRASVFSAALTGPLTAWAAAGSCPTAARLRQATAAMPGSAMALGGCAAGAHSTLLRCWRPTRLRQYYTVLSCCRPSVSCATQPIAAWGYPWSHAPSNAVGLVGAVPQETACKGTALAASTGASTHHVALSSHGRARTIAVGTPGARDVAVGAVGRVGRGGRGTGRAPPAPQGGQGRQQRPLPQGQQQPHQMKPTGLQEPKQKESRKQYTGGKGSGSGEARLAGRSAGGSAGVAAGGLGQVARTGQLGGSVNTGDSSSTGAQLLQTPGAARTLSSRSGGGSSSSSSSSVEGGLPALLRLLLRVVRPLDEAGYAYCAVGPTAAWLQGAQLMPPRPLQQQQQPDLVEREGQQGQQREQVQAVAELCVEVQWDHMQVGHGTGLAVVWWTLHAWCAPATSPMALCYSSAWLQRLWAWCFSHLVHFRTCAWRTIVVPCPRRNAGKHACASRHSFAPQGALAT